MSDKHRTLFKALNRIKDENPEIKLVKIYYVDEENFTIKGIDENGVKCYTKRKSKDKKIEAFDSDYVRRTKQ